tara:strand:- start:763 stop:1035 length:273 start_codon:yes stop_codon:yes gene_type:complete
MNVKFKKRTKESKREKFLELASKRVERVSRGLDLISNLSNSYYYEWEESELNDILDHLNEKFDDVIKAFNYQIRNKNKDKDERNKFKIGK